MWLLIIGFAAAVVTLIWYSRAERDDYLFRYLCLILWGGAIMGFVDRLVKFFAEDGPFIDPSIEATVLGLSMLLAALIFWELLMLVKDPRRTLRRRGWDT
jgi:lipoprotein signal peptidase